MKIKRITSILLSVMIMLTLVCGCFAVSAGAAGTITYSYVINTDQPVNAFEGAIIYPAASLSVNKVTFDESCGQYYDQGGRIPFNASNTSDAFDFSGGKTMITVEFNVIGDYDEDDLYGRLDEFYNNDMVASGNLTFDYTNVVDGEVISSGHTDIDTPANSYADTKYTIVYSYNDAPEHTAKYTRTAWSHLNSAQTIAEINMPNIVNPYYENYSVDTVSLENTTISAALTKENKKYTVNLNRTKQGEFEYLQQATVNADEEKSFFINGKRVYKGTAFTFFVTGDTDVTTDTPAGEIGETATLVSNALYVSDNTKTAGDAHIKMEMLASATSAGFSRMGVAFAKESKTEAELKGAIEQVTTGTGTYSKIAVHNSKVDMPNVSGQYQFIYAPYVSVNNQKVSKDTSLYFYSYVVNADGDITVSSPQQVNFSNVLA